MGAKAVWGVEWEEEREGETGTVGDQNPERAWAGLRLMRASSDDD